MGSPSAVFIRFSSRLAEYGRSAIDCGLAKGTAALPLHDLAGFRRLLPVFFTVPAGNLDDGPPKRFSFGFLLIEAYAGLAAIDYGPAE